MIGDKFFKKLLVINHLQTKLLQFLRVQLFESRHHSVKQLKYFIFVDYPANTIYYYFVHGQPDDCCDLGHRNRHKRTEFDG